MTVRRVLFLHAHPDDETLATGGTIAVLAEQGVRVGVLTATRGERGEVVPGVLDPSADLTAYRLAELSAALTVLGVTDHWLLGEPPARAASAAPRRYTDSGMRWSATGSAVPAVDITPDSLTAAPVQEVTGDLQALIEAVGPDLVISYDAGGGYGHPDHRRVHEAALAAATASGVPFAEVVSADVAETARREVETVDVSAQRQRLQLALRGYRSQLERVESDHVVHVGGQRQQLQDAEYLRLR